VAAEVAEVGRQASLRASWCDSAEVLQLAAPCLAPLPPAGLRRWEDAPQEPGSRAVAPAVRTAPRPLSSVPAAARPRGRDLPLARPAWTPQSGGKGRALAALTPGSWQPPSLPIWLLCPRGVPGHA
jgi:hypothetical protein